MKPFALSRLLVVLPWLAVASHAQPQPPTPPPPAEPTLDDLLKLPKAAPKEKPAETKPEDATADKAAQKPAPPVDPAKAELDRQLSEQAAKDDFEEAVSLMEQSTERLSRSGDAGVDTQRLQKQTLDRLDKLIDMAKKQKSKSKSKSKSKQNSDSQSQSQQQQSSQSQQQQQQQQSQQAQGGANTPLNPDGKLNPPPGAGAAWGGLPERLRDALMQGSGDKVSSTWESLTREYYKRLAEQAPGEGAPR
ncbi:MAG: hypothetical protein JSR77_03125 [Planctomycetes bacterium]|nr:hypothetical protein [Planctomycetota bacterium]